MKEMKFKTNIQCGNCLSKVKPFIEAETKVESWHVNLEHPDRTLTISSSTLEFSDIQKIVSQSGFSAEPIN